MTIQKFRQLIDAKTIIGELHPDSDISELITDSRAHVRDASRTIFAALRTRVADGHRFIPELYGRGVRHFIVDKLPDTSAMPDATFYVVETVSDALANMASNLLKDVKQGIIITGSTGKTQLKELLYRALASQCRVAHSPRSWNSAIGIPLAIWEMVSSSIPQVTLTEAGIDGPGQGDRIARILGHSHPIGVISTITDEHDDNFKSHRDKIREKIDIVRHCRVIIYADNDPVLADELHALGTSNPLLKLVPVASHTPTPLHALAEATIKEMGLDASAVSTIPPVKTRREIQSAEFGNTLILDNFTADLTSLRHALQFMHGHSGPRSRKALILGQLMASDGTPADTPVYIEAFNLAAEYGIKTIICIPSLTNVSEAHVPGVEVLFMDGRQSDMLARYHTGTLIRDSHILLFGLDQGTADAFSVAGHDTTLDVDLDAIVHNYNAYRRLVPPGTGIIAMVKASAYGLGSVEIGRTLQSHGASYLAVAVIDEAIDLRDAGITMPIIVLNPVTNRYPAVFGSGIEPAVFSIDELRRLIDEATQAGITGYPVHIKLDTGMHRVGFTADELEILISTLVSQQALHVASVFSHLATADCPDLDKYTRSQFDSFYSMVQRLEAALGYPVKRHILNTAGMMRFAEVGHYDMARLGIGLYGILPVDASLPILRNVATFRSRIISIKHLSAGSSVGYGCRGKLTRDSIIATVPVGYADGVDRRLGCGNASFMINGKLCPTVGNICMDLCMVDVTRVPGVAVGDDVEIFGEHVPVQRIADALDTIPYEILTSVSPRVRRIYFKK